MTESKGMLIEEMGLNVKTYNALKRARLLTDVDIAELTYRDLLRTRNISKKDADAIKEIIEKNGLRLKG